MTGSLPCIINLLTGQLAFRIEKQSSGLCQQQMHLRILYTGSLLFSTFFLPFNYLSKESYTTRMCSLETPLSYYNLRTEHNIKTKLTSINFSRRGTEGFRSSWLQVLGNQLIDRSPYIRYTNHKGYLLYCFLLNY